MDIFHLIVLAVFAGVLGPLKNGRSLGLLCVSALVVYWLQPYQEPINLMYWLPTVTLLITALTWLLTSTPEVRGWKNNWQAMLVLVGVIVLVDMNRYFKIEQFFVTETPRLQWVGLVILVVVMVALLLTRLKEYPSAWLVIAAVGLIVLLVVLKSPSVLDMLFETVSTTFGNDADNLPLISWFGFSYVSFRLLHTIFDRWAGRLPSVSLADYVNYVIFFPAFAAGPIDRLERFVRDLKDPVALDAAGWVDAGFRLALGMFKKFVIADALAWIALNDVFAKDAKSVVWMWVLLYAYSFRIYFDFSGYTDIAIGLGRLLGIRLPENFATPYLKPNLTQFWNSWHMTLTQWFRAYFFNPFTRVLRSGAKPLSTPLTILVTQLATMLLIGLWHGVSASFALWGLWHGLGLFIQNRWSVFANIQRYPWAQTLVMRNVLKISGVFLTFNFVSLGWLFFALSTPELAWEAALKLFGVQ